MPIRNVFEIVAIEIGILNVVEIVYQTSKL